MKIFNRHLLAVWCGNFLLIFMILNVLLIMGNLVRLGSYMTLALPMIPVLIPGMLTFSFPMSALVGTITTLTGCRLKREFTTLAASGVGVVRGFHSLFFAGVLLSVLTFVNMQWIQPGAELLRAKYIGNIGARFYESLLENDQAQFVLGDFRLHVFKTDGGNRSIIIQEARNGRIAREIYAEKANISLDERKKVFSLSMQNVTFIAYSDSLELTTMNFATAHHEIPYTESFSEQAGFRQYSLTGLYSLIKKSEFTADEGVVAAEFHQRVALILASLVLVLVSFPIVFIMGPENRLFGFLLGMAVIFGFYYPFLKQMSELVEGGISLPWLWPQLPNLLLLLAGGLGIRHLDRKI
ncbi:MAG: LptF/LptG family permease [Planctomycetes bacterium]|nr:LptF/LptG family permease [Planctomycetota bacterium]